MRHTFQRFASWSANLVGSAGAFLVAAVFCLVWAASGPHFAYSNSWQLVANTVTNVATFLLVFLIQYSQNRNTQATQLKLDELVRAVQGARNQMIRVEELPDAELDRLEREMRQLRSRSPRSPT
ncbi:MAG: low affinity iron permease family protein [Gemmatimonadaceae bacterium]